MVDCFADGVFLCLGKGTSILNVIGGRRADRTMALVPPPVPADAIV
jgi:predicted RNA methylase